MTLPVLLRQGAVLVVDKPAGWPVIPGRGEAKTPSVREALEAELGQKVFVVHRLDRDTSGALVFALDAKTHRALSMAFEAGQIEKRYQALVKGRLEAPVDVDVALAPARRGRMRPAKPGEVGQASKTLVRPLEHFAHCTLVEAVPLTGRTHQIRVHLAHLGHPLLVDHQYGDAAAVRAQDLGGEGQAEVLTRTPLHAVAIRWTGLPGVKDLDLTAPLPGDMAEALRLLRASVT